MVKTDSAAMIDFGFLDDNDSSAKSSQSTSKPPPPPKKAVPSLAALPTFRATISKTKRTPTVLGNYEKPRLKSRLSKPSKLTIATNSTSSSNSDVKKLTPYQKQEIGKQRAVLFSSSFRCATEADLAKMSESQHRYHLERQVHMLYQLIDAKARADVKPKELFCDSPAGKKEIGRVYLRFLCAPQTDAATVYAPPFAHTNDLKLFCKEGINSGTILYGSRFEKEYDIFESRVMASRDYHDQSKIKIVRSKMDYYDSSVEAIGKQLCADWCIDLPQPPVAYEVWTKKLVAKIGIEKELDNLWCKKGYQPTPHVRRAYCCVLEAVCAERQRCLRSDFVRVYKASKKIFEQPIPRTMNSQVAEDAEFDWTEI